MKRKLSKLLLTMATVAFAGVLSAPAMALADSRTVSAWDSLEAALSESGTVVLGCDMSAEGNLLSVSPGVTVTLDLGGNTLMVSGIKNEGNLTVVDGTIEGLSSAYSAIESTGALTIDANVVGARHALRIEGGTATIEGGAYSVKGAAGMTTHVVNAGSGANEVSVTINGGTFTGPKGTSSDSGYAVQAQGKAVVTINGGVFEKGMPSVVAEDGENAELVITGGAFDEGVTTWLAEGAVQIDGGKVLYFDPSATTYEISTVDDLWGFAALANAGNNFAGKTVSLTSDIDLGGKTWTPIASFAGEFDGNCHTISNFRIDATQSHGGFFARVSWGSVHDLTLEDVTAEVGAKRFGVLVAQATGIDLNNITIKNVDVKTASSDAWVGGLSAYMEVYSQLKMQNCTVEDLSVDASAGADFIAGVAAIIQRNGDDAQGTNVLDNLDVNGFTVTVGDSDSDGCGVGGIFTQTQTGWQNPRLTSCDVAGIDVKASGLVDVGGMIAWPGAHTTAENCTTEGKIDVTGVTSADCFAGGFFGNLGWNGNLGSKGGHKLTNCSADVDITTKIAPAGGFVGSATNSNNSDMPAAFANCIAAGDIICVEGGTANIGGFAGEADRGAYTDCSASGILTNNGTGYAGQFIGGNVESEKVTIVNHVAKIGDEKFTTLQAAVDAVKATEGAHAITLLADCAEDIVVEQAENVSIIIDGDFNNFTGTITVDGKSSRYDSAALEIKNVCFDAKDINFDACIRLGNGTNDTRYTNHVTVTNCTFVDGNNGKNKVAIKSYTGGDKNLKVSGCSVDETMHSLLQVANVTGLEVDLCTVGSKNGINLNSSSNVVIKNSSINVSGYAVRIGVDEGTSGEVVLSNNVLSSSDTSGEDAVVILRGTAVDQADLSMTKNAVSGAIHITGTDGDAVIAANKNYWDGKSAPVVKEGDEAVSVANYYSDANRKKLIWNDPTAYIGESGSSGIKEGTFSKNPSEYLAPGYYPYRNADGTYTVRPIPYIPPSEPLPDTGCADGAACNVFNDVDPNAWYHEAIDWAVENGILRGYDDGSGNVGPEDATLRSHVVVMLHRMAGEPEAASDAPFADVKVGAWYDEAVAWAYEVGLTTGYTAGEKAGSFGVNDVMTREQMATMLYRFAILNGCDASVGEDTNILSYVDALQVSEYAVPALQWAVGSGIMSGYADGSNRLGPNDDAERAHFAAMLMRMDEAYGIL